MDRTLEEEIAFLRERLRLAADVIDKLAEQQAMPDDWYLGPLEFIRDAGRELEPVPVAYTDKLPPYGDLIDVQEWKDSVACHGFIDYDGFGHPVKDGKMSNMTIYPSIADQLPDDATHVMWFNR